MAFTPLVPPLFEARVNDWIRLHIERVAAPASAVDLDGNPLGGCTLSLVAPEELDEAAANKRSPDFERLRGPRVRNELFERERMVRLRMGHLRYGICGWDSTDRVASMRKRLAAYTRDHNLEHMVDIANLAEIEWIWPNHKRTDFFPEDLPVPELATLSMSLEGYACHAHPRTLACLSNAAEQEFAIPSYPDAHLTAIDRGDSEWSLRNQK